MIYDWPSVLSISDRTDPRLQFNTRSGGMALNGVEQVLSPLSERWTWQIQVPVWNAVQGRALRSFVTKMQGRFNFARIGICDQFRIPPGAWGRDSRLDWPHGVPHSDGAYFSDGAGYALSQLVVNTVGNATINGGSITVPAAPLMGQMSDGLFISIDGFLYVITGWSVSGANYVLQISPRLRAAVPSGSQVLFSGNSVWQFASDGEGALPLQIGRFGVTTINLIEPYGRTIA